MPGLRVPSVLLALAVATLFTAPSLAQAPTTFNYQGRLLENTADQDAVSTAVDIDFSIWSDATGGSQLWSESWTGVPLTNGIFSVLLGSNGSPLDPADFQGDSSLFLQLVVDGETLTPRQMLGSAPFAVVDEPENELQDLSLSGNTLSLSDDPTSVDLSPYLDDTDNQDLSLTGNTLALSNDPTPVDLSAYLDNTDVQTLSLSGDTLTISGSDSSVDLGDAMEFSTLSDRVSALEDALNRTVFVSSATFTGSNIGSLENADTACQMLADGAGLDGVYLAWLSDSEASPATRFDRLGSFDLVDGVNVADSWGDLTDGTLDGAIAVDEAGTAVAASRVWTGTATDGSAAADNCGGWQAASTGQSGDSSATGSGWTASSTADDCSQAGRLYCFEQISLGVDNQQLSLAGNTLQLTSADGIDTVDLSPYLDDTDTDNQVLSLSGTTLQLTSDDGTDTVSLASFLDNTDSQTLSLSGKTLSIAGGNSVSLDGVDDDQTLSLSGDSLSISGGNSVNISSADDQTLSLSGNTLSIANGNSISLSKYLDNTDSQDIASVLSNGTDAGNRDLTNLDDVDIDKLTVDANFECDADTANCIESSHIEKDTILGNDITDRIFIVWIDCNGNCNDMSMREACDVIEDQRNLDFEVELMGVSCVHSVPSTTGNGFEDCPNVPDQDNECRSFELRTLGDIPCINGDGTDAIVTCYQTDIAK